MCIKVALIFPINTHYENCGVLILLYTDYVTRHKEQKNVAWQWEAMCDCVTSLAKRAAAAPSDVGLHCNFYNNQWIVSNSYF